MQQLDVLQRMRERTSELVGQQLRSTSVVLSHLRALIVEAHGNGHSHKAIHASLEAAGLRASWNTYKSCLMRMRKATRAPPAAPDAASPKDTTDRALDARSAGPLTQPGAAVGEESATLLVASSSPIRVMEALQQAREVAYSKDYAQISRDLYRQAQRNRRNKDRS